MYSFRYRFLILILSVVAFFAAAQTHAEGVLKDDHANQAHQNIVPVSQGSERNEDLAYKLGADDELRITVFGERDLSGQYNVSGDGFISLPLLGELHVEGHTTRSLEGRIAAMLRDGYILNPSVAIQLTERRPFYILGEVRNPGSYTYVSNMSVLNAVALAGGFTYRAKQDEVEIMRTRGVHKDTLEDVETKTVVAPGDIILVKERFF